MKYFIILLVGAFPHLAIAGSLCGSMSDGMYKAIGVTSCPVVSPITKDGNSSNSNTCVSCKKNPGQVAVAHPVNLSSGAMWHEQLDFVVPGRTPATSLVLRRTYTAVTATAPGAFGPNWHHNYETKLTFVPVNGSSFYDILWIDEGGGAFLFHRKQDGSYITPPGNQFVLSEHSDHYEVRKDDQTIYFYGKSSNPGKILKITDNHGESLNFSYDGNKRLAQVSAPFVGEMNFVYNSQGLVVQVVRVRDNLTYSYTYQNDGRLASVTDFQGRSYMFSYVSDRPGTLAQGLLSSIVDPIGRTLSFFYDAIGRTISQQEPGGGKWFFSYRDHETDVVAPDGYKTKYFFDENSREIRRILPDSTRMTKVWVNGYPTSTLTEFGGATVTGYDAGGNMNSIKRPADESPTVITYDQSFNKPILVQPPVGASTQYTLDPNTGDVLQMSRGGLSLGFTRDSFGNLLSVNNGRTTYSDQRDANGFLTRKFDLHNPETRSYDARGRLVQRQFQSGRTLAYAYDDYDRVISTTDSTGPAVTFQYDAMGRLTQKTVSAGGTSQSTSYQYDDRDRLVAVTDALNRTTTFQYDPVHVIDKPQSFTDPAGRITRFQYDVRDRLIQKTDALGAVTKYTYDNRDNLTSVTDANGNVTTYSYDLNNRKIQEVRPSVAGTTAARRVQQYFYDAADHLLREVTLSATGGQNRAINYEYDPLDRLVHKVIQRESATSSTVEDDSTFAYENQLDAVLLNSAFNRVANLSFTNEAAPPFAGIGFGMAASQSGNPLGLIQGSFAISRDVTGEIASVAKDGANLFTKSYDPAGRLTAVNAGGFSTSLGYDAFGWKASVIHSEGASGSFQYDLLNRVTSSVWKEGFADSVSEYLTYDLPGNVSHVGRENSHYDLSFDPVDQLTQSVFAGLEGVPSYNKQFGYDLLGNAISGSRGPASFVSNFLTQNGTSSFAADPDGFGEVKAETTGDQVKNYSYRADGKISGFQSGNLTVNYFYDGLDRLVSKSVNDNGNQYTQSFVHLGLENRVLLGKAGDGSITTYIDGQGVGEHLGEVKNGVGKGYITDHLGSVLNSAPAGDSRTLGLFGEPAVKPAISSAAPPKEYAFAGYAYRREDGNYETDNRVYNPLTGRWLSQDPIGYLAQDPNFYRYVGNSPLRFTDPRGLIHYNNPPPKTVPPTGTTKDRLQCVEACLAVKTQNADLDILVNGGAEKVGHSKNSSHYKGEACDIAGPKFNKGIGDAEIRECASSCGFEAGQFESFPNENRNHWHFQNTPGNGVPPLDEGYEIEYP